MRPESEVFALRLERDLPINGAGPEKWLKAHQADVRALLDREPVTVLSELTGISRGVILRSQRILKPGATQDKVIDIADLAYERGRADAYRDALEMATRR